VSVAFQLRVDAPRDQHIAGHRLVDLRWFSCGIFLGNARLERYRKANNIPRL
jgi:hypothetical protein